MTNSTTDAPYHSSTRETPDDTGDSASVDDPGTPATTETEPKAATESKSARRKRTRREDDAYVPRVTLFAAAKRLADKPAFQSTVIVVILLNALVLALETYPDLKEAGENVWHILDRAFLVFFIGEIVVRMAAVSFSPARFFRRGWNVFDFLIVAVALVPGLPPDSTVLRLARLARVTRLLAVLPDVKVLLDGIKRSLQPVSGLAVITVFLLFVYGMVGHMLFGAAAPDQWGTIGAAMLTLFTVLTLEAWPDIFAVVQDVSPWSTVFFISFLLIAVFIVMNMVVGVILATLEDAREAARNRRESEERAEHAQEVAAEKARDEVLLEGIEALRAELAEVKRRLPTDTPRPSRETTPS